MNLLDDFLDFEQGFRQSRAEFYQSWDSLTQCSGHEPQKIFRRAKFGHIKNSVLIPSPAFGFLTGKFTDPDLNDLPDEFADQIAVPAVQLLISLSKFIHRRNGPVLIIELCCSQNRGLPIRAVCQFFDDAPEEVLIVAFGGLKSVL